MDLKRRDDRHKPGPIEMTLMGLSILVTVALFGYVLYQGVTAPEEALVEARVDHAEAQEGGVAVHVVVSNPSSTGFRSVTVEVDCTEPAPQATLENIPASSSREVVFLCPEDTQAPSAAIVSTERA